MTSRTLDQNFYHFPELPWLELRRTEFSTQHYKPHSHQQLSIGAILDGSTQVCYLGKMQQAEKGDLVIINPGHIHYCNPETGHFRSYYMLYLDAHWCLQKLSALFDQSSDLADHSAISVQRRSCKDDSDIVASKNLQIFCPDMTLQQPALLQLYLDTVHHLLNQELSEAEQALDQLIFNLFSQFFTPISGQQEEHRFTRYCRQRLLQDIVGPPAIESIAEELNCRTETLIRRFKKDTGISPKAFLNNARIEQARILLKSGLPLADIAQMTGFSDQSHFHKAFVSHTSSTPGQYQKADFR